MRHDKNSNNFQIEVKTKMIEARTVSSIGFDVGFLGKNMQRIFNRAWNYIGKGVIGTTAICLVYPASCLILSTLSFAAGILAPIW